MATFKEVIRNKRADGFYPVYIRVVHRSRMGYIKTEKLVTEKQLTKAHEIKDAYVKSYCSREILRYTEKINKQDVSHLSVKELIEFLTAPEEDVCFSAFARKFISEMEEEGHERNAKNYKLALGHLERFVGSDKLMFGQLTSTVINKWIISLLPTKSAKEHYPTCLRQIFKKAILEYNDEEHDIRRIKFNPWVKITIPKADGTVKRAISAEECREFFNRPLPPSKMANPLPELARDVALLSLCLAGINTVDLYQLKKKDYHDGIIGYKRQKTSSHRSDEAYIEMRVEPFIKPTFDKYLSKDKDDEFLFTFHKRYKNFDRFNVNINIGIRHICKDMGMPEDEKYSYYTFRHTWATIAQNDCGANIYEVAFGMNHSHGFNVTRGYIKIDFTPAWELNAKVIDFIFFSNKKSKQGKAVDLEQTKDALFRITKKMMIYGRAYFKGNVVAELTDIGFKNVDEVIVALVKQLPKDIPVGCMVQFRLMNCDSHREAVYERSKGKGF